MRLLAPFLFKGDFMAQYDGSIRINTEITDKQAEKELKRLESSISKTADEIASLRSKMDSLKDVKIPTQEYKEVQTQIENTKKKIDDLVARQEKFLTTGGKETSSTYKRMQYDLEELRNSLPYLKGELQELINSGKAFTLGSDTGEYAQMSAQMQQLNQKMQSDTQRQSELQSALAAEEQRLADIKSNAIVSDQEIINKLERIKQLEQEIRDLKSVGVMTGYKDYDNRISELSRLKQEVKDYGNTTSEVESSYKNLGESIRNSFSLIGKSLKDIPIAAAKKGVEGLKSAFRGFGNIGKKTLSFIGSGLKKATSHMLGFGKSAKNSGGLISTLGSRFKGLALSLLIFNQISKAFNAMISGIKTGFSNFAKYSSSYAQSIQNMKNAMATLGNQVAAAFAPIVQAAIPILVSLINTLTRAAAAVAQFIAAITGKSTYKMATAIQKDYASSLKKTAGAAKDASKQLSSLDKLNNLTSQKSGGGGGGGGASGAGDMFEDADVSSQIKDFANLIKKSWEEADFTEVGSIIGKKLKTALDNIPWEGIKESARKIGKSIATLINGFVEVEGLGESIGRTLAEPINTGFEFLNSFVHNLHWESVGKFIADSISGFFKNIDWDLIYDTFVTGAEGLGNAINSFVDNLDWETISNSVSNFVNTFVDTIYTFVTTVDWKELGEKVGKTISDAWVGIDWKKAGETLGETFKAFFDFIGKAIENVDWRAVGESVKDFLVGIDWAGVAESFFEAIGAAIGGLAAFLGVLIADGVEAAKEYFQGKIEEAGGNVVLGILKGITDGIAGIGNWIVEHIFQPFMDGFKKAFGIHSPSTVMEEMGTYIVQGLLDGITSLVDNVKEIWESMKETALEIWNSVKENLSETWSSIKENAGEVWENIKTTISDKWGNIKQNTSETWENIKSSLSGKWENLRSTAKEKFESIKKSAQTNFENIKTKAGELGEKFGKLKDKTRSAFDSMKSKISSASDSMKDKLSGFIDKVKDAINAIKDFFSSGFDKVGNAVSSIFGGKKKSAEQSNFPVSSASSSFPEFSQYSIPRLATGTVVPPNREFMAVLGDNKREPEVVSPLSTIERAVENAMRRNGGMGSGEITIKIPVEIDGNVLFELIKKLDMQQFNRTGRPSFQI